MRTLPFLNKPHHTPFLFSSPRRWLISAAHCLCGTVVRCQGDYSAYTKVFNWNHFDNSRIKISMHGDPDIEAAKVIKLVIHPNYFSYTGNTVLGNTDLALIKMEQDLFQLEEGKILGKISPICLPAKLGFEVGKDRREDGIHQPFEDLDCFLIECKPCPSCIPMFSLLFQPRLQFPIPTTGGGPAVAGWPATLELCQPLTRPTLPGGPLASLPTAPLGERISTRRCEEGGV